MRPEQRELEALFDGRRVALQFSGGKDSLVVLHLLKPWWNRLIVLWGSMGDPFPELAARIREVAKDVAEFHEVRGNSRAELAMPVDLLPIRNTAIGAALEPSGQVPLQSSVECCFRNFWAPLAQAVKDLRIDVVIRAQRDNEKYRNSALKHGMRDENGMLIVFPIRGWSESEVFDYIRENEIELPPSYEYVKSSLKCMQCTAYQRMLKGKLAYMRRYHPIEAQEYERRLLLVAKQLQPDIDAMTETLKEITQ